MKRNTMLKILNPMLGLLVAICSLLHLVLNWSWVKTNFFGGVQAGERLKAKD